MIKTSHKLHFLTNDCGNPSYGVSPNILINEMSNNLTIDEVEDFLENLSTTDLTDPTDEDRLHIQQLEQTLISLDPGSPPLTSTTSSNDSFGPTSEESLLNPRDVNLIDVDPNLPIPIGMTGSSTLINRMPEAMQSTAILSPVSPLTDVTQTIDCLSLNRVAQNVSSVISQPFASPPNVESSTQLLTEDLVNYPRVRYYSEGAYNIDGTPHVMLFNETTFSDSISQPIRSSNRSGHSVQPYVRSLTDPLPEFDSAFRRNQQMSSNFEPPLAPTSQNNPMPAQAEHFPLSYRVGRWNSEPVLPHVVREHPRITTNHRGRPFSRHHPRRAPTARERREQLESELTTHEITNYELHTRVRSLLSATQYLRHRLRERGWSQTQLDAIQSQMNRRFNPSERPN